MAKTPDSEVLVRKICSLNEALTKRLASPMPVDRDLEMHLASIDGHRALLAELELELATLRRE